MIQPSPVIHQQGTKRTKYLHMFGTGHQVCLQGVPNESSKHFAHLFERSQPKAWTLSCFFSILERLNSAKMRNCSAGTVYARWMQSSLKPTSRAVDILDSFKLKAHLGVWEGISLQTFEPNLWTSHEIVRNHNMTPKRVQMYRYICTAYCASCCGLIESMSFKRLVTSSTYWKQRPLES